MGRLRAQDTARTTEPTGQPGRRLHQLKKKLYIKNTHAQRVQVRKVDTGGDVSPCTPRRHTTPQGSSGGKERWQPMPLAPSYARVFYPPRTASVCEKSYGKRTQFSVIPGTKR
jgi:hypothetical protein